MHVTGMLVVYTNCRQVAAAIGGHQPLRGSRAIPARPLQDQLDSRRLCGAHFGRNVDLVDLLDAGIADGCQVNNLIADEMCRLPLRMFQQKMDDRIGEKGLERRNLWLVCAWGAAGRRLGRRLPAGTRQFKGLLRVARLQ